MPDSPSTDELKNLYPIADDSLFSIGQERAEISKALEAPECSTLGIVGPCARPSIDFIDVILDEGRRVAETSLKDKGLHVLHRGPTWKPRTNPNDWHGEETTDPVGAYLSTKLEAETLFHVAMEIGYEQQLGRYASLLTFAWIGSRNIENAELIQAVAEFDPNLPVGVKNGLDGDIYKALNGVNLLNNHRFSDEAPAILIFRGGHNATNPTDWKLAYREAYEATEGKIIVDVAHGSEMAHDPSGNNSKSTSGQILAMEAVIDIAEQGLAPAGIMIEASDLSSKTDPHMPLGVALKGLMKLHAEKIFRA